MKSNKGITLISLVASLLLVLILAATTIVTSMNAYKQMKFEGAKAEIEEMQKLVNELASDYQTYLKEEGNTTKTYSDYFNTRYNVTASSELFTNKLLSTSENKAAAKTIIGKYSELESAVNETNPSQAVFYFKSNDLVKYFDLKGIDDVVVDFTTRTVYSVDGIKDSSDSTKVYYTPVDWGSNTNVKYEKASKTAYLKSANISGATKDVELTLWSDSGFSKYFKSTNAITEVYYMDTSVNKYIKFDDFRDISTDKQTVLRVTVASGKTYKFKVVDDMKNVYETALTLTR